MRKLVLTLSTLVLALGAGAQDSQDSQYAQGLDSSPAPMSTLDASQFDTPVIDFDIINDTPPRWYRKGLGGITLSQVSLTNWAAGGEGQVAFDALFNYDIDYTNRRHLWQNRIELAYGLSRTDQLGKRKTNDKIFLTSMYGYRLSQQWYASMLGVFSTQFSKGYDYNTTPRTYLSRFMAPGYLGLGVGFTWRPVSWFSAYMSPAAWRGTFVLDDKLFQDASGNMVKNPYGVSPGKHLYNEFGANVRLELDRDLVPGLHVYSRLDLFSNYLSKPQNVDVRWYVLLTARINRWVSANLSFNMLYDDNIRFVRSNGTVGGSKLQIKEVLGIGLQRRF